MLAEIALEPNLDDILIDSSGRPTNIFIEWMAIVTQNSNNSIPLTGTGSPEGNVIADQGRYYVDITGPTGVIYYKQTGFHNTGWLISS